MLVPKAPDGHPSGPYPGFGWIALRDLPVKIIFLYGPRFGVFMRLADGMGSGTPCAGSPSPEAAVFLPCQSLFHNSFVRGALVGDGGHGSISDLPQ